MALPLLAGGKLLGALDIQSTEEGAFTQEDIEVLQILADQVSIAIENSNLFAESELAVEASRRAYGELSRQAWMVLLQGRPVYGYRTDSRGNIQPVEGGWSEELAEVQKAGQSIKLDAKTLAIPFKILDMPAGVIKLKKHADAREWSEREINLIESLVGNLGEALESARLYEDTQRRAERERITADIATRIRESLDVDTVLQTAALEMRRALNLEEITIRLGESDGQ
jgi:GAF domain-containing protein